MKIATHAARTAVVVLGLLCGGCFFYDSRWGQREEEQKHAAERLRPRRLEHGSKGKQGVARVARVRAHATRAYVAETLNWEKRFNDLLQDASAVLGPDFGVVLESAGTSVWQPQSPEDRMDALLEELSVVDSGENAEWVVGFVQSTPKLVTDYHLLGVGQAFSKHLVVRASNDPRELEMITRGLDELDEIERNRLYGERKHHRMVTVFLHEIGHTLGALHRTEAGSIMTPSYDPEARAYDSATIGLLRITLPHHLDPRAHPPPYGSVLAYLDEKTQGWVDAERVDRGRWLAAAAGSAPEPAEPVTAPAAQEGSPAPQRIDALPAEARAAYDRAIQSEYRGDVTDAWNRGAPLFEAYPQVLEVQELRCRLAKLKRFYSLVVDAHCAPALELAGKKERAAADAPTQ